MNVYFSLFLECRFPCMNWRICDHFEFVFSLFLFEPFCYAENFPPKILVGPLEVNVTVNTSARISITAKDANNDSLSFSVAGNLPTGHTTASNETAITLSWNVTTAQVKGGMAKQQ